jgi:hypothetical protein
MMIYPVIYFYAMMIEIARQYPHPKTEHQFSESSLQFSYKVSLYFLDRIL